MNRTKLSLTILFTLVLVAGAAILLAFLNTPATDNSADAGSRSSSAASQNLSAQLREAVTPEDILEHERRFAAIAEEHGGNRAAGTPGYDASAEYVAETLREAGYEVSTQQFDLPDSAGAVDAELERTSPDPESYDRGDNFTIRRSSGDGEVTAPVGPVDFARPEGTAEVSSGCEPEDFEDFREGSVALLRRGGCTFEVKVENAEAAGAAAALISSSGSGGETGPFRGSLGESGSEIPVLATSAAVGEELADAEVRISVASEAGSGVTTNVIATSPSGDEDETVMLGAHLDSAAAGPGINDNGSGSATILQIAQELARLNPEPDKQVRFAFWGGEELGLLGSNYYVNQLGPQQVEDINVYLNFDMIASPNYVPFFYGTPRVTQVFENYFEARDMETYTFDLAGRSDHGPFADEDVPVGGIFSGDSSPKTEGQEEDYGGEAGEPYDECYHQACDTLDNLSLEALDVISDAAAHATAVFLRRD